MGQKVHALQTILDMALPDQAIHSDEIPWVPQGERVWFKPLRFDLVNGRWINLLKVSGGGKVNRHRHSGGQVLGYVIQGSWRYLEREWVARRETSTPWWWTGPKICSPSSCWKASSNTWMTTIISSIKTMSLLNLNAI